MDFRDKKPEDFNETDFLLFVDFLFSSKRDGSDGFHHAASGLAGEASEVLDHTKKMWVYDKELDVPKVIEEMGDVLHYFFQMMVKLRENGQDVVLRTFIANNVVKLRKRYPNGFSKEDAILRRDVVGGPASSASREVYRAPDNDAG